MALEFGILGYFNAIFAFLLVFVLSYGLLSYTKPFGDENKALYSIIALAIGVLAITSGGILKFISFVTPWFFVLILVGFFILFILMMFGLKHEDLTAGKSTELRTYVIIFTIVIILFGLGAAFGQGALEEGTGKTETAPTVEEEPTGLVNDGATGAPSETSTDNFGNNVLNTLVNPQVLGMILVLLVAVFAMFFLTKASFD